MDETKTTINFADNHPRGLKTYLLKRYKGKIDKIKNRLSKYFGEKVDVHYTFEDDKKSSWALDLDFYLVENKANYPIGTAGKRKLPVCFVITPPGFKKRGRNGRVLDREYIYKVDQKGRGIIILYKGNVSNISWDRLFDKALKVDMNKTKIFKEKSF